MGVGGHLSSTHTTKKMDPSSTIDNQRLIGPQLEFGSLQPLPQTTREILNAFIVLVESSSRLDIRKGLVRNGV